MLSRVLVWTLAAALATAACAAAPGDRDRLPSAPNRSWVRVALAADVPEVRIRVAGPCILESSDRRLEIGAATSLRARAQTLADGSVVVVVEAAGQHLRSDRIELRCGKEQPCFEVDGRSYAGSMVLRTGARTGVTLVNRLEIETYLRGVVPWEIGRPADALEAVKAQAIAARTYTYAHLGHWDELGFDLYADVNDQVYRGLDGTHVVTDRAVAETAGQVLRYRGELVRAYYSSTCGGHTSRLADVWPWREDADYLQGRRDAAGPESASWCRDSSQFRWSTAWTARELGEVVRETLPVEYGGALAPEDIGRLEALEVLERDNSGRVQRLDVVTDLARFEVEGDRIRWVLRPVKERFGILRSTMFEVENLRREGSLVAVRLSGGGFGHGVGMCQSGAMGMARAGRRAEQILQHYYPGTTVGSRSGGRWP